MKKILTVYTGGTICCEAADKMRNLNPALAKRALISNYSNGNSKFSRLADQIFEDSNLSLENQTLSENMTLQKLEIIIEHIKSFDLKKYCGIIVMHGTDTLAFTASIFSYVFSYIDIPMMIVSGNRPPLDERSNANENFKTAVELIMNGIAPNVYVPYLNSDDKMYLHLGTNVMQCPNYSEDFRGADSDKSIVVRKMFRNRVVEKSKAFKRIPKINFSKFDRSVLYLSPYMGFDYAKINLEGIKSIVHGSYHSGTVCVERSNENERYSSFSALYFAEECKKRKISLFVAPSKLDSDQYSSVYDLSKNSSAVLLDMTHESAYAKVLVGVSSGLSGEELKEFVKNTSC